MHDRIRRQVCRWLFLLLAALPTSLLAAWSLYQQSSAGKEARCRFWQQRLAQLLLVDVAIDHVQTPFPGTVMLENVIVSRPGVPEPLAKIKSLRIAGRELASVHLEEVQVHARQFNFWRGWLERWSRRFGPDESIKVTGKSILCQSQGSVHAFADLVGVIRGRQGASEAIFNFWQEGTDGDPLAIQCSHDHGRPRECRWIVQTGTTPLAGSLLTELIPGYGRFGEKMQFSGLMSLGLEPDHSRVQLAGMLEKVDLGLLTDGLVVAEGDVEVRSCLLRDGACQALDITVQSPEGTVSAAWLNSVAEGWGNSTRLTPGDRELGYSRLACRIELGTSGLRISSPNGADLIRMGDRVLLAAPPAAWLPVTSVVRLLAPGGGEYVPANRKALEIYQALRPIRRF